MRPSRPCSVTPESVLVLLFGTDRCVERRWNSISQRRSKRRSSKRKRAYLLGWEITLLVPTPDGLPSPLVWGGDVEERASVGKKSLEGQDPCPANDSARTGSNSSGFIDSRSLSVWTIGKRSGACGTKETKEKGRQFGWRIRGYCQEGV
jgi:hypothetical protein